MLFEQLIYAIEIEQQGSISKAAKSLFISQPTVSNAIMKLEEEIGIMIFERNSKGTQLTDNGREFLRYAHQLVDQSEMVKKIFRESGKTHTEFFSISCQHYSFAIPIFTSLEREINSDEYVLRLKQTKTLTVIEDVAYQKSEIGIIAVSEFSSRHIENVLISNNLTFKSLFTSNPHIFIHKSHPLANHMEINIEDLHNYPCIIYDQNENISFFFSEELTIPNFKPSKILYSSDLVTSITMMKYCEGFNIGTGVLALEIPGFDEFIAIPVKDHERLRVGVIMLNGHKLSNIGEKFIELCRDYLKKYRIDIDF